MKTLEPTQEPEPITEAELLHIVVFGNLTKDHIVRTITHLQREDGNERIFVKMIANGNQNVPEVVQDLARWQVIGDIQANIVLANTPAKSINPNGSSSKERENGHGSGL